ncbi:MAG: glutaredoxin family protein [Ignavibacteria bacterium]|nr:glutaredoxin family protein [Ignavibacteria bacterium]
MAEIVLYSKNNCHLCDEMKIVLTNLQREYRFKLTEFDIESDNELFAKYREKIPVLTINGKLFAKYRIDEKKLIKKLESISFQNI